jgi:hypothetical protein
MSHPDSGADDERTAGTLEHGADGFDGALVELAAFRKSCPVVPESNVKDGIGCGSSCAQAFQIFQIPSLCLSSVRDQRLGARVAARKAEHLVTCADEFRDNSGSNETRGACDENTHVFLLDLFPPSIDEPVSLRLKRRYSPNQ